MNSKLELLKKMKSELITIKGLENYPQDNPSIIIANHNCLMDIFYLPLSLPIPSISLISPRLIYKKIPDRQEMINK